MADERRADDRRSDTGDRRSGVPGPIPGGVDRRSGDDRRSARAPRRDDLAGTGRTALTAVAAMRARDVDRPTEADLVRAEAQLTIVRRHWIPPAS